MVFATWLRPLFLKNRGLAVGRKRQPCHRRSDRGSRNRTPELLEARTLLSGETFSLHSLAGAHHRVYLDFNGHTTPGTSWNSLYAGGADIVSAPFSLDADTTTFSADEEGVIRDLWAAVAEDFAPFAVDVTTEDPGAEALRKTLADPLDTDWGIRVVISGSSSWYPGGNQGVAFVGSFDADKDVPAFVFSDRIPVYSPARFLPIVNPISHEVGHSMGLTHDGSTTTQPLGPPAGEYYYGHETSTEGLYWAPTMGKPVTSFSVLTQWSKGEYSGADNTQDDLAIITTENGFGYRTDDHGNSPETASVVAVADSQHASSGGFIERNTDVDAFRFFVTQAGTVQIQLESALTDQFASYGGVVVSNLDILGKLLDANGQLISSSNPSDSLDASLTATLSAGTYYVSIDGVGRGSPSTNGYSDYGSLGAYTINLATTDAILSVSAPNGAPNDLALSESSIAEKRPVGTTVGALSTVDLDTGDSFTYSLVTGTGDTDNGSFAIVGNELQTNAVFNYETKSSYGVRVRTTDQAGLFFEKSFTISVADVNEAPTNVSLSATSIAEHLAVGITVGTLSGTDQDSGEAFTFSLVSGAGDTGNEFFAISGNQLRTAATFDLATQSSHSIRVRATDAGGLSTEQTFMITVTASNRVGYVDDREYSTGNESYIVAAGRTPVRLTDADLLPETLATLEALIIGLGNPERPQSLMENYPNVVNWVQSGGRLVIHDSNPAANAIQDIVPGLDSATFVGSGEGDHTSRDMDVIDLASPIVTGLFGTITNMSLDGGNWSTHGYVLDLSLPGFVSRVFSAGDEPGGSPIADPDQVAVIAYAFGDGFVVYSTIPVEYYTATNDGGNFGVNLRTIYLPNELDAVLRFEPFQNASISISTATASQSEGDSGNTAFTFTVMRTGGAGGPLTVDYALTGSGDHPAGVSDFGGAFPSGVLTFASDETSKTLTFDVSGDTTPEPDEGFRVTLSNPGSGTTIAVASASGTILNDDAFPPLTQLTQLETDAYFLGLNDYRGGSTPAFDFAVANDFVFLRARTETTGTELWKTDGTSAGTRRVRDIVSGPDDTSLFDFVYVNGTLFFTADDGIHGLELWKSDGTEAGMVLVRDINPGADSAFGQIGFRNLTNVNGTLFFIAEDGIHGRSLWKSDGTEAGTALVKDLIPTQTFDTPDSLVNVDGMLFFAGPSPSGGEALWKSDGTEAGTQIIKSLSPFSGSLTDVNGTLFFIVDDGFGTGLWKSDGTPAGTSLVKSIERSGDNFPRDLINVSGRLFFSAPD